MLATPEEFRTLAFREYERAVLTRSFYWWRQSLEWVVADQDCKRMGDELAHAEEMVRAGVPRWIIVPVAWESTLVDLRNADVPSSSPTTGDGAVD